jgi:hypothetical protein
MKYTLRVETPNIPNVKVRTYSIYDDRGQRVGSALRNGAEVTFQIQGGPVIKRKTNNAEETINSWAENRATLGEDKEYNVILLNKDGETRTYAIMHGTKPIGRAIRDKGKQLVFQVTGYEPVRMYGSNVERMITGWLNRNYDSSINEGDVVKHKFGLKQQQKNKTKYRFYQEIKDDIPVFDRGTHSAILPKYIESHRHPENLEPFDHFEVQPSVSGVNGRMLGITKDGMKVFFAASRLETAKALVDAYNRGGFSDLDIEKVPLEPTESRRPSAALRGIAEADKEHPGRDAIRKYIQRQHDMRKATGADVARKHALNRTKAERVTFDDLEKHVLQLVGEKTYNSDDPADIERVENIRLALKRKLSKQNLSDKQHSEKLSKFEKSVDISNKAYTGYVDEAGYESSWQKRYRTDPEFRERQKQNERNRRKNPEYAEKKREYQRERSRKLYADPDWREEDLARRRDIYAANKDAVLAKRQALMKDPAYAARKAEYWKQDAAKRKELTQKFQQLVQDPDFDPGKLPTAELKKFIKFLEKGRV